MKQVINKSLWYMLETIAVLPLVTLCYWVNQYCTRINSSFKISNRKRGRWTSVFSKCLFDVEYLNNSKCCLRKWTWISLNKELISSWPVIISSLLSKNFFSLAISKIFNTILISCIKLKLIQAFWGADLGLLWQSSIHSQFVLVTILYLWVIPSVNKLQTRINVLFQVNVLSIIMSHCK